MNSSFKPPICAVFFYAELYSVGKMASSPKLDGSRRFGRMESEPPFLVVDEPTAASWGGDVYLFSGCEKF